MRLLVQSAANLTTKATRAQAQRCFATSSAVRKDFVQDLYLRELKAYKPAPAAKDAHVGAVREFQAPKPPTAPSLPADFAAELAAYDASEPTLAPKSSTSSAAAASGKDAKDAHSQENTLGGPALLEFLKQDLPNDEHHHH
ncbi:hypothetical protein CPB86DRAFT_814068 [Serendipita vermifera]|nr:hypothetical protein CPB86DRAFT_814068 [Serendipita vermifera]